MRIAAVLNREGGTLRTMDLDAFCVQATDVFAAQGHELECHIVAGAEIEAALQTAADDPAIDAILAGGGDGTISAAAGIAFKTGKPLGVLPAGTMNLFARSLQVPLALEDALVALASGEVAAVDIATANGRPFVHQFGVGVHARLVRLREQMNYGSRIGKILASLRAIIAAAVNPPRFEAELHALKTEHRTVSGIAVSNNPLGDGHIPHADRLDAGVLGIYLAAPLTTTDLVKLTIDVFMGTWRASPMVSEREVKEAVLRFPKRKRGAHAVIDGELIALEREIDLRIHPGALKVIRPKVNVEPGGTVFGLMR